MSGAPAAAALRAAGLSRRDLDAVAPVGGGCINESARLRTTRGSFFLKWNRDAGEEFFRAEAEGLDALAATETVRIPRVVARSEKGAAVHWLLLEWIERRSAAAPDWARLGRELAALHQRSLASRTDEQTAKAAPHPRPADRPERHPRNAPGPNPSVPGPAPGPRYGWPAANFIGPLPQPNAETADWPGFWVRHRILPLARELRAAGAFSAAEAGEIDQVAARMEALLEPASADGPSLLHGDLWSGNVLFGADGRPALVDPAVYHGHRETDLAMAALFGGFDPAFHAAYEEAWPLLPGHENRRAAYQLYPLLVHARLFGGSYVGQAVAAARRAG